MACCNSVNITGYDRSSGTRCVILIITLSNKSSRARGMLGQLRTLWPGSLQQEHFLWDLEGPCAFSMNAGEEEIVLVDILWNSFCITVNGFNKFFGGYPIQDLNMKSISVLSFSAVFFLTRFIFSKKKIKNSGFIKVLNTKT